MPPNYLFQNVLCICLLTGGLVIIHASEDLFTQPPYDAVRVVPYIELPKASHLAPLHDSFAV